MSECNHDCSTCTQNCSERKIEKITTNEQSKVRHVIGVLSGKGGVGKSFVSALLASELRKRNYNVGVLDADITGPSIPQAFGIDTPAMGENGMVYPAITKTGISVISSSMFLQHKEDPIIWRGVMLGEMVKQFYHDVYWNDVDFLVVDMPPGTGDIALTTFQFLPVDAIVIVTSPQDLVSTIVQKAVRMATMMDVPILGLVENMAYVECPCCNEKIEIYGKSHVQEVADAYGYDVLARIPLRADNAALADQGKVEFIDGDFLSTLVDRVEELDNKEE